MDSGAWQITAMRSRSWTQLSTFYRLTLRVLISPLLLLSLQISLYLFLGLYLNICLISNLPPYLTTNFCTQKQNSQ